MLLWCVEWDELCPNGVWMRRVTDPVDEVDAEGFYKRIESHLLLKTRNVVVREA